MRERIVAANDATYAAWNAHDADAVAAIYAPDGEAHDVGLPEPTRGREAMRQRAVDLFVAFPGMEPTGNRIEVLGATFTQFDGDGLVVRDHHFWDVPTLLAQLGAGA